jgi:hypothetical protein
MWPACLIQPTKNLRVRYGSSDHRLHQPSPPRYESHHIAPVDHYIRCPLANPFRSWEMTQLRSIIRRIPRAEPLRFDPKLAEQY